MTKVCSFQKINVDETLMKILDLYFDTEAHNMDNFDPTMLQFPAYRQAGNCGFMSLLAKNN